MQLQEIIPAAAGTGAADVEITALAYDNRRVTPGTLFFCVPGFTRDGHDFAPEAIERGAAALVVDRPLGLGVPEVVVADVRTAMAPAAAALHGDPTASLDVVGITGTNGKTTTAFLTRALLEAGGRQTGLLGTIRAIVGGVANDAVRTTPEAIDLQATFAAMRDRGDRACVMEVSSHALELRRADAIHWDVAVFTNLTQDHLDFHPTMDEYFAAKRRLFEMAGRAGSISVINLDDTYGRLLKATTPDAVTYAIDAPDAQLRAVDVAFDLRSSQFTLDGTRFTLPMPGRFNVLNALAAIASARALGLDDATIAAALPDAARVPGRFEPIDEGQSFAVLVDYAHTPDSLENVLTAARALTDGRLISVFGCGGDRDRGKRPQMGEISARLADRTIVTSDNPRSEDPGAIVEEIVAGIADRSHVDAIIDRRDAISAAVSEARDGDVVVIAGKGHEQGQEFADGEKHEFDDATVAREALRGITEPAR